jgi:ankyrin repeat protein
MADTVKLLLGRGADIEAKNNDGATPLILAASRADAEHVKIVKLLLAHGAQVEAKDAQGATALDRARKQRRTAIVGLLKAAAARQP